ncbi:MAG: glucosaminidase domain-containing protein [Candidatus Bilamarchaeaceae archaeon]
MEKQKIRSKSLVTSEIANKWLANKGCPQYAEFYKKYGEKYGVRWDIAICQSCLETGFWTFQGDVSREQNNFAGIGATGGGVKGDSFSTPEEGIHAQIQNLALRSGAKIFKHEIISPYVKKNYETIAARNSEYWEDLTGTYAADKHYHEKIYKIYDDMLAYSAKNSNEKGDTNMTKEVNWFEFYRKENGKPAIVAYSGSEAVDILESEDGITIEKIAQFGNKHNAMKRTIQVAPAGKKLPEIMNNDVQKPVNKKVLIDPGHSDKHPGARGKNPSVKEEVLNRFQAQLLKEELEKLGISATIYDPVDDDLDAIGLKAQGYDAFISLHLNAFNNKEHYTCAMIHPEFQKPSSLSVKVASEWAQAIAEAIGNPCFRGTEGYPKGVYATGLKVLRAAAKTDCPIFFLSEAEFIDDEIEESGIRERLKKAMKAGAGILAKYLK